MCVASCEFRVGTYLVTGNYSVSNRVDSVGIVCVCVCVCCVCVCGEGGGLGNGKKGLEFLPYRLTVLLVRAVAMQLLGS